MEAVFPKKRGPKKRGYVEFHVLLPPYLVDWGKEQEGGLSDLVRTLLKKEYERQHQRQAAGS